MTDSTPPLGLFIQPACLQHKYIRHPNSSHIFERPERLRAVLLGVAAAVARLEQAEERVRESLDGSNADDLSSLLSGLSIQSSFQQPRHLSIVPPPIPSSPGQVLMHHPALQLAHSSPSPALLDGQAIPSSTYLRDLNKWASEAVETIKQTGCEIPSGLGLNQGDLYLAPGSVLAIEGAVQTVCQAIDKVCNYKPCLIPTVKIEPSTPPESGSSAASGSSDTKPFNKAFCAIRPPGHHCGEDTPSGFCYVNNVVVGALHAYLQHDIERAIIIDFDLHHGNGTQALVMPLNEASHAEDLAVKAGKPPSGPMGKDGRRRRGWKGFYGSVHDIYSYPCEDGDLDLVKDASLSLAAHGQYIENIHLQPYNSEADFYDRIYPKYLALLDKAKNFMDETGAEAGKTIVLISAGFDACEHEHQGMQRHDRRVPTSFFSRYTKDIVTFADKYTGGKVVSVLEGGYSDRALTSAAMGHVIGMLDQQGQDGWWSEPELVSIEKASKKKRTGRIAPLAPELTSYPHLVRTHALLGHFETVGSPIESAPASVANTPQHSSARMTLRDRSERRKAGGYGYEDEVTPPPTVSRRGRGTGTGSTPRGKASATPSTPLARKAVHNSKMASPASAEDVSMTPTGHSQAGSIPTKVSPKTPKHASPAIPASQLPPLPPSTNTTPIGHQSESELSPDTPTVQRPRPPPPPPPQTAVANASASASTSSEDPDAKVVGSQQRVVPVPVPGPTNVKTGKIMLRFTRPSPLPPSEIPSLPSPITPLPPSHPTLYPNLPNFATSSSEHPSTDQRFAYREGSASTATSEDYLSARSIPSEHERGKREETQDSSASSDAPQMPGGLR